jgi:hypothetical protein
MANSQTEVTKSKIKTDFSADLYSRYIWRGLQYGGTSPSIQPGVSVSKGNLEFGIWGAYSIGGVNSDEEVDLYLSYTFLNDMFTTTVTDYFFPSEVTDYNYFDYGKNTTGHVYEAVLNFNGTDNIPLTFLASINFYGADAARINNDASSADFNTKTGILYSNYFELGYSKELRNEIGFSAFAGFTLTKTMSADTLTGYVGESGYYGGGNAGFINLGVTFTKALKINDNFALPLTSSLILNPRDKKIYFVFGLTF